MYGVQYTIRMIIIGFLRKINSFKGFMHISSDKRSVLMNCMGHRCMYRLSSPALLSVICK